jgi:hypothetical protein
MCNLKATRVFEVATGQPAGPRLDAGGFILDGAFSPDGRQAAILVSRALTQEAWYVLRHGLPAISLSTLGLMGSPPGQGPFLGAPLLVFGRSEIPYIVHESTQPGQLQLWDWRTGQRLFDPLALPSEPRCLDYSLDGRTLAVICSGGQFVLVDPGSGRAQQQWQARPDYPTNRWHINNGAVRISPDSRSVLIFGTEDVVQVRDIATGQPRYAPLQHQDRCTDVQFSPDGRLVSTASYDNTVRVWELETGRPVGEPLRHPDWVHTAPFSPDGNYLLTGCKDSTARLWDWRAGREVGAFKHDHEVHAVAFTPDGRWVLTASDDKTLRVWESVTGKPVTPPWELGGYGLSLSVTPDGKHAVVGGFGKELHVFDLGDLAGDTTLGADDLVVWGELLSGQRIHKGSGVTNLTAEEWLQRWRDYRGRLPMKEAAPSSTKW